jgi:glutamate/tyrosine decarboxylase-like PLP-dependent enzyme
VSVRSSSFSYFQRHELTEAFSQEATASVAIESLTIDYLLTLLSLPRNVFDQNTLTTGATSSNFLGLALGRNFAISSVKARQGIEDWSVSEDGHGGVEVDVFVVDAHASMRKAASLAGIGRRNVYGIGNKELEKKGYWCCFDLEELERRLKANFENGRGSVVATSFGEVNSG